MQTTDFTNFDLLDAWYEQDPAMRIRVNFPFYAATAMNARPSSTLRSSPGTTSARTPIAPRRSC